MPPRWEFYTHFDRDGYLNIREEPCFCFAFTFNQIEFCSEAKKSSPPFIRFSAIIYFVTILEDITRQEKNILKLNPKVENLTEKYRGEISDNKKKQWVSRMLWFNVVFKITFWPTQTKFQCYNCESEAIYWCCWNAAYCSTECQQNHWHRWKFSHMDLPSSYRFEILNLHFVFSTHTAIEWLMGNYYGQPLENFKGLLNICLTSFKC